jgi:nucleotide-binding universal stress UspA family protein
MGLVVGVDGSAASDAATRRAARDAAMRGMPLALLHAVMPTSADSTRGPAPGANQWQQDQAPQIVRQASKLVDEVAGDAVPDLHTEVRFARVVPTLHALSGAMGSLLPRLDDRCGCLPLPRTALRPPSTTTHTLADDQTSSAVLMHP